MPLDRADNSNVTKSPVEDQRPVVVNVQLGQFGGPLRNGDMIALLNVVEHLRQLSGLRVKIFLASHVIFETKFNHEFKEFLIQTTDYVSPHAGNYQFDCNGINLWDYRCASRDLITIKNLDSIQRKICFFPVFDATYIAHKNWPIEHIQNVIEEYSSSLYKEYEKVFCAVGKPETLDLREFNLSVGFKENLSHIMTCEIFIGGDTGTSHFASVLRPGPLQKIYYYATGSAVHTVPFHLSDGHSELRLMWWDNYGKNPKIRPILVTETSEMRVFALRDATIGDVLSAFPALYKLALTCDYRIWIGNSEIRQLWAGPKEILLSEDPGDNSETLTIHMIFNAFSSSGLHMVQAWHWCLGLTVPLSWPRPALNINTDTKQDVDVFISPVSNSDAGTGLKVWPDDKWCRLIDVLLGAGLTVAVGGQFSLGKSHRFWGDRAVLEVDAPPLRDLAANLRSARCVVTVDNGVGHLAYFLGVPHVHLIPEAPTLSAKEWVENKSGEGHVIYERFAYLTVEQVLGGIFSTLGKFNIEAYWDANRDLEQVKPRSEWRASEIWLHYVFCGRGEGRTLRL